MEKEPNFPFLLQYLIEVSRKSNYEVDVIDRNLIRVSYNTKSFLAGANGDVGINPINSHFACEIANDKARTISILREEGFRVPTGEHFFVSDIYSEKGKELKDVFHYVKSVGFPVFVKPNRSSAAKLAEAVYSEEKLKEHLDKIARFGSIVLVQEVVNLPEYRIVTVDGEFQYSCKKVNPRIVGDGVKTVYELIHDFNDKLDKNVIEVDSHFVRAQLEHRKLNSNSILEEGDSLPVASIANLWAGGGITDYSETISNATKKWIKKVSRVFNLRVMGLDVFAEGSINNPGNMIILEVNHNPGHKVAPPEKVQKIIKLVCQKYFNEMIR